MSGNRIVSEDVGRILQAPLPWGIFSGATVVVTGAGGFLAAYLVEVLAALHELGRGPRIIGLVRNHEKARARFSDILHQGCLELVVHDVSTPFPDSLPQADFVIHAASNASPKFFGADPVGTIMANTFGTAHALEYARRSKSSGMLYFSSGEVYGIPSNPDQAVGEGDYGFLDPLSVRSCYAEGKRCGETMCVSWACQHQVAVKIVRPFHTYGPGMALDDGRVFADFVADVVAGRDIVLKSDGADKRPFCYLADATAGFFYVLLKGESAMAYNVGNPSGEIAIRDLAEIVAGLHPEKTLKVVREAASSQSSTYLKSPLKRAFPSIEKLSNLGWLPTTSVQEGFRRTVTSYMAR